MDNRKRALSESGWSEGTGSRFRRELDFGKLAGKQEPAGFGTTGRIGAPVRIGAGSKGINFRILLFSSHLCKCYLELSKRPSLSHFL